jgi:5-(carboxyamino)imidazole ribonucleotide synthase
MMSGAGDVIAPGGTIGILGSGQLGRMIALAAANFGLKTHVYAPEAEGPAFDVATYRTHAAYEDEAALARFAASVAVVTYEFENVPAQTARIVEAHGVLRPGARALAITQDRLTEKDFVAGLGLPLAAYRAIDDLADLERAVADLGRPCVLKTRRFGHDGKGQVKIGPQTDLATAYAALAGAPAVLEAFVPFTREVSVVAARGLDGTVVAFDMCENCHKDHILDVTRVPARIDPARAARGLDMAGAIASALDYVGVLAVEMFVVEEGGREALVVNEIAPRVHNSGHWTIEGAETSQFAQHVRAVCGWPLGSVARWGAVTMTNLIGADAHDWMRWLAEPGAHLHLYGKGEARPGRKMGHVTQVECQPILPG